ncbi:UDP-glucose/GDP-mannose dehydrogenase family protein [Halobacillus rhizosphaerae]|uniref:UDP-glucose dehydrogenase family protein n=1 Tax=Halobacillus rhizosphaerae TaxID=3064889 RepID=UPI00398BB63C
MKISVVGTGYVGLVTGVTLSDIGHTVTCIDIDNEKIQKMKKGISPIYEPGLDELMSKNIKNKRLYFTNDSSEGFREQEVIYIAVGTPEADNGSADLEFIEKVAIDIAKNLKKDAIVVTKSTVPVGTNEKIQELINLNKDSAIKVEVVSNPEFLKEGSAINDSFNGERIVVGSNSIRAAKVIEKINEPFNIPVFKTDIRSAEMIKYASNAFLATKISYINEVANICSRVGANVEDVSNGMGLDSRIGSEFLNAGIGYGGSCFPKDTKALIHLAGLHNNNFDLLREVVKVNNNQQSIIVDKLIDRLSSINGKKIAVLGLSFKPNTDDMRDAPSLKVIETLLKYNANVIAYDPIAINNAKKVLKHKVLFTESIEEAIDKSDATLILTEWNEVKNIDLKLFSKMNYPLVIDGRNCFDLEKMRYENIEYHSIGRPPIMQSSECIVVQ